MRMFTLTTLAASFAAFTFAGTAAVKADGNAAVCSQSYGPNEGLRCDFYNYQQCQAHVSGLAASCIVNPYLRSSSNQMPSGPGTRR